MQIVVGLLCDGDGVPISTEVFEGNTNDVKTLHSQIKKASKNFHARKVVFVGDRGMIKKAQQNELSEADFDFITALTKCQIEKLIKQNVIQLSLFDEQLSEIILENEKRYILKRNPIRAREISENRMSKLSQIRKIIFDRNDYLNKHARAKSDIALNYCNNKLRKLKVDSWTTLRLQESGRAIELLEDSTKLEELSRLDGCYCLTTSLSSDEYDKDFVHSRYKDLAMVENAFRTFKTGQLEMRPIYVRKDSRTRGHVFVVMLSYFIVTKITRQLQKLRDSCKNLDMTVEEGLQLLETLCTTKIQFSDKESNSATIQKVPNPREDIQQLFVLSAIPLPVILPAREKTIPQTRKKLN
jgi:transposase